MPTAAPGLGGTVGRLRSQARTITSGFTTGQKAMVGIATLAVVIGAYLFMSWAGKPSYQPLFSNLSSGDAAAITSKLTSAKVPYQLTDGGATILVPANDVYQQRLNMSGAGLPGDASSGYSLLNKAGVTSSQFQQQVDYQQAVQTELDHTIEAIQGVSGAVVHVVIPSDQVFAGSTSAPSASVLVQLVPGVTLSPTQVQAIVHLVASSVENLDPANVTVVDNKGDVLSAPGTDGAALAAGDAHGQQTQSFEQSLDTTLTNMLTPILGPGNAVVTVSADLNYDQTQTTSKQYDPGKTGPIPVSTSGSTETYSGPGAAGAAGGTLGQTVPGGTTSGGTGTYNQSTTAGNAVVSEVDKTIQSSPGTINRLSVAVVLNKSVKGINAAQVQSLVSSAAGLVPSRGDSISVASLPFDTTAQVAATKALKAATSASSSSKMVGTARSAAVVLSVVGLLVYALRRLTRTTRTDLVLPEGWAPAALGPAPGDDPDRDATTVLRAIPVGAPAGAGALAELADHDPAEIAQLLRSWLAEEPR